MSTARNVLAVALAPLFALACVVTFAGQQSGASAGESSGGNAGQSAGQSAAPSPATGGAAQTVSDPVLAAMTAEIERSKTLLKMDNVPAPYYVEYRVTDVDEFDAEAAFGALRENQRNHARNLRVVVRVGGYKQDSYGPGGGMGVADIAPLEDDPVALRRDLWLATDRAYKAAAQALANKRANQTQFSGDQEFDDFAHAQPLQSVGPLARLDFDAKPWTDMLAKSSALFRTDPKLDSLAAQARFRVVNEYFANSEGTVTRHGSEVYALSLEASTQAADGMSLSRSPDFVAAKLADLPTPEQFQTATSDMIATLKALREAPLVEEDYRGPVLFAPDAAADVVARLIGGNVVGARPRGGDSGRALGSWASSYKSRVLPAFLSAADDPTMRAFQGKSLVGSYEIDSEGVRAQKVSLIENGQLVNYLLGRQPIRDFPESNGHGRAAPGQPARAGVANLILQSSQPSSPGELKKKLLDICRDQNMPYGYYAVTLNERALGPGQPVEIYPVLLYRVYAQDGHEELVRGAVFNELDTRSLRNDVVAAGNDPLVSNRATGTPTTVISPSILFDELEVRRTTEKNERLPEYSPPDLNSASH